MHSVFVYTTPYYIIQTNKKYPPQNLLSRSALRLHRNFTRFLHVHCYLRLLLPVPRYVYSLALWCTAALPLPAFEICAWQVENECRMHNLLYSGWGTLLIWSTGSSLAHESLKSARHSLCSQTRQGTGTGGTILTYMVHTSVTLSLRTFYMGRRRFLTYHVTRVTWPLTLLKYSSTQVPLGINISTLHVILLVPVYSTYPHLSSTSHPRYLSTNNPQSSIITILSLPDYIIQYITIPPTLIRSCALLVL